jgi:hypothetical protein
MKALVDTGATYSVLLDSTARDAGIILPSTANFFVQFGDSVVPARLVRVDLLLGRWRLRPPVAFVERLSFRYALLGRLGVLARFRRVAFIERSANPWIEFVGP